MAPTSLFWKVTLSTLCLLHVYPELGRERKTFASSFLNKSVFFLCGSRFAKDLLVCRFSNPVLSIVPGNDENGEETATFQTLDKDGNGHLSQIFCRGPFIFLFGDEKIICVHLVTILGFLIKARQLLESESFLKLWLHPSTHCRPIIWAKKDSKLNLFTMRLNH